MTLAFIDNIHSFANLQTTPPPSPQLLPSLSTLSHLFTLFRQKWICDFLFTTEPAHLATITAPMSTQEALACHISSTRYANFDSLPLTEPVSQHCDASLVFIPAFSVSNISVGFGIQHNRSLSLHPQHAPSLVPLLVTPNVTKSEKEQFRFLRDDKNAVTVLLYNSPEKDFFRVDFMRHETATRRLRCFFYLNRSQVLDSLNRAAGSLNPADITSAASIFQAGFDFRLCPKCGQNPYPTCTCQLDLGLPKHSLDHKSAVKHMSSHIGYFHGYAELSKFSQGQVTETISLATTIKVEDAARRDLVEDLTRWAIKEHIRECRAALSNSIPSAVPASGYSEMNVSEFPLEWTERDSQIDADQVDKSCNALKSQVSPCMASAAIPLDFCNPVESWLCSRTSSEQTISDSFSDFEQSSPWENGVASVEPYDYGFSLGDSKEGFYLDFDKFWGSSFDVDTRGDGDSRTGLHDDIDVIASPSGPCGETIDQVKVQTSSPRVDQENLLEGVGALKQPLSSAAEGGIPSPADLEPEQLANESRKQKGDAWKKQLKIERNRASARRSNMKKKEANDARKRERKRLQDLEVQLKRIEQTLRTENLMLRKMLVE
eukprot:GFKZ01003965.1.p1 GENE.GFKZ01003965.1~~GFKZ01003965.1.p1  ORF type:complete len:629 (+),score=60.15 GFKZ01003965.1:82-1887(+)